MTPKERAEFTLNRVNRWLLAGNREVAVYHIEQAIIAAENERAKQVREEMKQNSREKTVSQTATRMAWRIYGPAIIGFALMAIGFFILASGVFD